MHGHPIAQRILRDPIALATLLTVPALLIQYSHKKFYWSDGSVQQGLHFRFLFDPLPTDRVHYNYAALIIIWAVAIIRWKWQKEDKAEQG